MAGFAERLCEMQEVVGVVISYQDAQGVTEFMWADILVLGPGGDVPGEAGVLRTTNLTRGDQLCSASCLSH